MAFLRIAPRVIHTMIKCCKFRENRIHYNNNLIKKIASAASNVYTCLTIPES